VRVRVHGRFIFISSPIGSTKIKGTGVPQAGAVVQPGTQPSHVWSCAQVGEWTLYDEKDEHPGGAVVIADGSTTLTVTRGWVQGKRLGEFHGIARDDHRVIQLLYYVRDEAVPHALNIFVGLSY
jgi:hypothetical protein